MQNIGPFIIILPNDDHSAVSTLHWCYFVWDEQKTWSMKTLPVSDTGAVPDWNSTALSKVASMPKNIQVVARPNSQGSLLWSNDCAVLMGHKIFGYSPFKNEVSWYYHAEEEQYITLPTVDDARILSGDFPVLTSESQREILADQYDRWYKAKYGELSSTAVYACIRDVGDEKKTTVEKIQAMTTLRLLLSDRQADVYILAMQLWFNGSQVMLERRFNDAVLGMFSKLSLDEFTSTIDTLLTQGWFPQPLNYYAHLVNNLPFEKARVLIQHPIFHQQIGRLLLDDFQIGLFRVRADGFAYNERDDLMRATILAIPEVKDTLQRMITSAEELKALPWGDGNWNYTTLKNDIVQVIGIERVKSWITDGNSLLTIKGCTTRALFSQLIWDNMPLYRDSVLAHVSSVRHAIATLFSNPVRNDDEILQKVTEFVNGFPEGNDKTLFNEYTYRDILASRTIRPEQKTRFFEIPRIKQSITWQVYESMLNEGSIAAPTRQAVYDALFPEKIKQFIMQSNGDVIRFLTPNQKERARTLFSAEDLQYKAYIFDIKPGFLDDQQVQNTQIQPSFIMSLLSSPATPIAAAILLLAGVALITAAHMVVGASVITASGLLMLGFFMSKSNCVRKQDPEESLGLADNPQVKWLRVSDDSTTPRV